MDITMWYRSEKVIGIGWKNVAQWKVIYFCIFLFCRILCGLYCDISFIDFYDVIEWNLSIDSIKLSDKLCNQKMDINWRQFGKK